MSTYNLRRFAQPDVLKNIQQANLFTSLKRYESYLTGRGFSFKLDEDGKPDFECLSRVLMNPTNDIDNNFVEELLLIDEMFDKKHFDELHKVAETNKIETQDDVSPADLALTLLLHDPEPLERAHAEVSLLKPKKQFMYFMSKKKAPDEFAVAEHARDR